MAQGGSRRRFRRRWWAGPAAVVLAAVGAGCGSASLDAATVGHEVAQHANPRMELISVADLPSGWAVDNSSSGSDTTCANVDQFLVRDQPAHAAQTFKRGLDEEVEELALVYPSSAQARAVNAAVDNHLAACKRFTVSAGGARATFHGSRFPLAPTRAQSMSSWRYTATSGGQTFSTYLAFVQLDDRLILVGYTGPGTPAGSFRELVGIALDKAG